MQYDILALNGPNLGMLGAREPEIYGSNTLNGLMRQLAEYGAGRGARVAAVQSDLEGALVEHILAARDKYQGLIFNPAGFTHTSVVLRDALQAVALPCVEVHLTNTAARDDFRRRSLTAGACIGQIMGFGATGYRLALDGLLEYLAAGSPAEENKKEQP